MPQEFNEQEFTTQLDAINQAAKMGNLNDLKDLHGQLMAQHKGYIDNPDARELLQLNPIAEAAAHNHVECVEFLIPWSDTHNPWNRALYRAVEHGNIESMSVLLPYTSQETIFECLVVAAYHQKWVCAQTIFENLDAKFYNDFQENLETTLLWSSQYHQHDLLKQLYPLCNIERALEYASTNDRWDDEQLLALTDYHTAVQQHALLSTVVETPTSERRAKM